MVTAPGPGEEPAPGEPGDPARPPGRSRRDGDPSPARGDGGEADPSAEAVRFWYRRHADRVYRYARWRTGSRATAEEVVSDVFLEAWRAADDYDAARGSVESWLLGIARNVVRRKRRELAREAERRGRRDLDDLETPRPGPEEELLRRERTGRLLEAVWALPERDRDLVALAYGGGLSRRRIAEMTGLTPGAVRTRLHRVLERLRERLDGEG